MKKHLLTLLLAILTLVIVACEMPQNGISDIPDNGDNPLVHARLNQDTLADAYAIETFVPEMIEIIKDYYDGTTSIVPLSLSMIDETQHELFTIQGRHGFNITVGEYTFTAYITMEISDSATLYDLIQDVYSYLDMPEETTTNLNLKTSYDHGVTAQWDTDDSLWINQSGVVTRPSYETGNQSVMVSVELSLNDVSETYTFHVTVLALPDPWLFNDIDEMLSAASIGTEVKVEGTVTALYDHGFLIYDGFYHLNIYTGTDPTVQHGNQVRVEGALSKYHTLWQIAHPNEITLLNASQNYHLPTGAMSINDLQDLDNYFFHGRPYKVQGTLESRTEASETQFFLTHNTHEIRLDFLSPNHQTLLSNFTNEHIEITLIYYTHHATQGVMMLFDGTIEDIEIVPELAYFFSADIPYDGPYLDAAFFDMELYDFFQGTYYGTGGAFSVTYEPWQCIDGDTTRFYYPQEMLDIMSSNNTSTRYFNVDTPETWPLGGEEEWGKPATEFVCDVLLKAESIVLQTDPGDRLFDHYGRLLAWIWIRLPGEEEYMLLNYLIVRQGLGEVAYLFGAGETEVTMYDGLTYTEWMWLGEDRAIDDEFGMHGNWLDWYWNYDANEPYYERW